VRRDDLTMQDREAVVQVADQIAAAIARRDVGSLRQLLAGDFVHRSHGGAAVDLEAFLTAIERIPGELQLVALEDVAVDLCSGGALVTGFQRARVLLAGTVVEERRGFVDWFVKRDGRWRIQAAVDLSPEPG
jgi:hypothetical protein